MARSPIDKPIWLFIIYISVFINSLVLFNSPFEFYIGYIAYLLLFPYFLRRHPLPKRVLAFFLYLFLFGITQILFGNNEAGYFFKVFFGVLLSYIFYYLFIIEMDFAVERLFQLYLKGCYIVAIIGLVQFFSYVIKFEPGYNYRWLLNKWGVPVGGNFGIRVNSVFGEPSYYAMFMTSACFVAFYNLLSFSGYYYSKLQAMIVIISSFLSFSGAGTLGLFISVFLLMLNFGLIRYFVVFIPVGFLGYSYLYNNVEDFRDRVDGTVSIFSTGEFEIGKTHGSSIVLYNNYHIAVENFKENPLGTGLGSHPVAFEKYSITKHIKLHGFALNKQDANSMFNRLLSETGLVGILLFIFIIFKFYVGRSPTFEINSYWIISNAILVMIIVYLLRQGHYFLNGFPFFVWLYYFNWMAYKEKLSKATGIVSSEIINEKTPGPLPLH